MEAARGRKQKKERGKSSAWRRKEIEVLLKVHFFPLISLWFVEEVDFLLLLRFFIRVYLIYFCFRFCLFINFVRYSYLFLFLCYFLLFLFAFFVFISFFYLA